MPLPAAEARPVALRERDPGFTLIELLVVVIILGILAAIAIPVYLGVQNNAKEAGTKSDLISNTTAIAAAGVDTGGAVPSSITSAGSATVPSGAVVPLSSHGWAKSAGTSLFADVANGPGTTSASWCLGATSTTSKVFFISSNRSVTTGTCPSDPTLW